MPFRGFPVRGLRNGGSEKQKGKSRMGKLTGTQHGDAANALLAFYVDKADELEQAGQYFMAAIALAFGIETAVLTYLLMEFGGR
jgi:hypothetical protein